MLPIRLISSLVILLSAVSTGYAGDATCKAIGKLDRFWRYQPALGPFHEQGQALIPIPAHATTGSDFNYVEKPFEREAPFADHLSMVRILGGFSDAKDSAVRERDLAYRDANGRIRHRFELLEPRLRPYLDSGIREFTMVLDNVPWCFPADPGEGSSLGQSRPPRDPQEWRDFVAAFCKEYVRIVGPEIAANTRFRIGTENNGRERFDGSHEEYVRHYQASAAGIQAVLPGAGIGPFNISSAGVAGMENRHNVRAFDLVEALLGQPNPFNGAPSTPVDFIAFSRYFSPGMDLEANTRAAGEAWDAFAERFPALGDFSREVHEFGVAPFGEEIKGRFVSQEFGALGGAATALMMFRLREAGADRVFHWSVADAFRDEEKEMHRLFTGQAWLRAVLERAAGGESFLLEPTEKSAANTNFLGLLSVQPHESVLIITAYNRDTANHTKESVTFELPAAMGPVDPAFLRAVVLDRGTAMHDIIRNDLAAAGLLAPRFVERPDRGGGVREMGAGREAESFVGHRLPDYHQVWQRSLTLQPVSDHAAVLKSANGITQITLQLAPPQLFVLVIPHK